MTIHRVMGGPPRGLDFCLNRTRAWSIPPALVPVPTLTNPLLLRKCPACPKGPDSMVFVGEVSPDPPPSALGAPTGSPDGTGPWPFAPAQWSSAREAHPTCPRTAEKAPNTQCQEETWSLLCACTHTPHLTPFTHEDPVLGVPPNPTSACGNQCHLLAVPRNVRLQTILSAHCSEH